MEVLNHRHWMNLYESGAASRPAMMCISTSGEIFAAELPDEGTSAARRFRKPLLYLEGVNVARFIPVEKWFQDVESRSSLLFRRRGRDC